VAHRREEPLSVSVATDTFVPNLYTYLGQEVPMKSKDTLLKSRVYGRICATGPSTVWGVGDFSDLGAFDAVRKALQRLTAAGSLRGIDRGLYYRPRLNTL